MTLGAHLEHKYLHEFSEKLETSLMGYSGVWQKNDS
jgi:hypothetical protein